MEESDPAQKIARQLQEVDEMLQKLGQTSWSDQRGEVSQGAGAIGPRTVDLSANYGSPLISFSPADDDQNRRGENAADKGDGIGIRKSTEGVQLARDGLYTTTISSSKDTGGFRVPPGFESSISPGLRSRETCHGSIGNKVHFASTPVVDRPENLPHQTSGLEQEFLELPPRLHN